jgi:hypothetical protein
MLVHWPAHVVVFLFFLSFFEGKKKPQQQQEGPVELTVLKLDIFYVSSMIMNNRTEKKIGRNSDIQSDFFNDASSCGWRERIEIKMTVFNNNHCLILDLGLGGRNFKWTVKSSFFLVISGLIFTLRLSSSLLFLNTHLKP